MNVGLKDELNIAFSLATSDDECKSGVEKLIGQLRISSVRAWATKTPRQQSVGTSRCSDQLCSPQLFIPALLARPQICLEFDACLPTVCNNKCYAIVLYSIYLTFCRHINMVVFIFKFYIHSKNISVKLVSGIEVVISW